ncbi:MAG TPA: PKD domain-containing protein, partial [Flavobacteriales bacterium]|nr:PKD domain-containing protein [Flavobacteriales bacterium]
VSMPGAWDPVLPVSTGYDIGVFKLLLDVPAPYSDVTISSSYGCEPNTVSFSTEPGTGGATLTWNFGDGTAPAVGVAPGHTYASAGNYTVTLSISGPCDTGTITTSVTAVDPPPMQVSTAAQLPCLSTDGASAHATVTGGLAPYTFVWSPTGGSASDADNLLPGNYTVTVTDHSGCETVTDDIVIEVASNQVFVPAAFSPNANGHNDEQCVYGTCISTMVFSIYDRLGNKVFETLDPKTCWDGKYNDEPMNAGVFVYHLSATLNNGETVEKQGNISLIR